MWFWRIYWCLIFYFKPYKNNSFSNKRGGWERKATFVPDIKLHCSFILALSVWAEFFPLPLLNNNNSSRSFGSEQTQRWPEYTGSSFIKQCPSSLIDRDEKTPGAWISREVGAIFGSHMNKYWHFHQGSPKPGTKWLQTYKWVDPGSKPALRWVCC